MGVPVLLKQGNIIGQAAVQLASAADVLAAAGLPLSGTVLPDPGGLAYGVVFTVTGEAYAAYVNVDDGAGNRSWMRLAGA